MQIVTDYIALFSLIIKEEIDLLVINYQIGKFYAKEIIEIINSAKIKTEVIVIATDEKPLLQEENELMKLGVKYFLREKFLNYNLLQTYIELVLTKVKEESSHQYEALKINDSFEIDLLKMEVIIDEVEVHLTPKEFDLLILFVNNAEIVLSRETIISRLWLDSDDVNSFRVVDTLVKQLRKKLNTNNIKTIRGKGYRWSES